MGHMRATAYLFSYHLPGAFIIYSVDANDIRVLLLEESHRSFRQRFLNGFLFAQNLESSLMLGVDPIFYLLLFFGSHPAGKGKIKPDALGGQIRSGLLYLRTPKTLSARRGADG